MQKQSALNVLMFLLSIVGAILAFIFGEALLVYVSYLPLFLQCGIYFLFVMAVCCVVLVVSEKIRTGNYLLKHRREFGLTAGKAALIFLPAALVLGIVTQFIYSLGEISLSDNPRFQGSMLVCDVSGSMLENDPRMDMVDAIVSYIEEIPVDEYIGVRLFNNETFSLREYSPLESEEDREELIETITDQIVYSGGTDIQNALLGAIDEMRDIEDDDWPGLVMLFSDGISEEEVSETVIREASVGRESNSRNRIPVNTIYFATSPLGGYQMNSIADITGGQYYYLGVGGSSSEFRNVFSNSRAEFDWQTDQHLIRSSTLVEGKTAARLAARIALLSLWGIFSGIFVVVFLNNSRLWKHFFITKVIVSVVFAAGLTVILLYMDEELGGRVARGVFALGLCALYLPTYRWEYGGPYGGGSYQQGPYQQGPYQQPYPQNPYQQPPNHQYPPYQQGNNYGPY